MLRWGQNVTPVAHFFWKGVEITLRYEIIWKKKYNTRPSNPTPAHSTQNFAEVFQKIQEVCISLVLRKEINFVLII